MRLQLGPKPFYRRGPITLYLGDCLDIEPRLRTPYDMVFTDPPYGIAYREQEPVKAHTLYQGKGRYYPEITGDVQSFEPWWAMYHGNVCIPTVLWGANYCCSQLPSGSKGYGWIVWDKQIPEGMNRAKVELAWTNWLPVQEIFRHRWQGFIRDSEHGEKYHPSPKPVALWEWILLHPSCPSGTILDPYCGAGSLAVAAVYQKYKYIGIETEEQYLKSAVKRCNNAFDLLESGRLDRFI